MHGEIPQQLLAKARGSSRRTVATAVILIAVLAALYYVFAGPAAQQRRANRFGTEGPIPVLVASVARANVPVYLDAVGTIKALNTVTVRPQVDGKLLSVNFKEGDDVKKGDVLAKIDPVIYQAQLNQAIAKKAQDEAQLANRSRPLRTTGCHCCHQQAAGGYATRTGRPEHRAGAGRPGCNRQRAGNARLHHHYRAARRPHRYPHGG